MIPLVQKYRGIIVDFVGDGILAFFEPIDEPLAEATKRCLQCAFDMQAAIDHLNQEMTARHLPALEHGDGGSITVRWWWAILARKRVKNMVLSVRQ